MRARVAAALALALLALGACDRSPAAARQPVAVHAVRLGPEVVETATRFSATVRPRQTVELSFRVPGTVVRVHQVDGPGGPRDVQEGDVVARGTVLAELEPRDFEREVDLADAHAARAEASLRRAEIGVVSARRERERVDGLFAQGVATEALRDEARSKLEAAEAERLAAEKDRNAARVALEQARDHLADCALRTPLLAGTIAAKHVEPQERVAGGTLAFAVMDCATVRVVFGVPDTMLGAAAVGSAATAAVASDGAIALGQTLHVVADALPGVRLAGRVTKIAPAADPVTRTFPTEVDLDNADGRLRPGMVVTIIVGATTRAVLLPLTALRRGDRPGEAVVFRVREEAGRATAERRRVALGGVFDDRVEVLVERSEVALGDRIVAVGASRLDDGQALRLLEPNIAPEGAREPAAAPDDP